MLKNFNRFVHSIYSAESLRTTESNIMIYSLKCGKITYMHSTE